MMQLLCLYKQAPAVFLHTNGGILLKEKRFMTNPSSCGIVHAVKDDSQSQQFEFELEPDKAREALKQLDDQIQSFSNTKPLSSSIPRLRVSEVKKLPTDQVSRGDKLEISNSFLATVAAALVLFTIFYNVLFYSVIKPSIDGS